MTSCNCVYRSDCGCGCIPPGVSFTFNLSSIAPDTTLCVLNPCGEKITVEDGDVVDIYGGCYPSDLIDLGVGNFTP